ncbi:MAG: chemotaxis protein MotA [Clostridia bacterium]|jgi:chemotaxis protein MotA|nr:MotA/TolQ/ExbB proton channel [Clostridiales bacterium]MDK2985138.1 chemotaxis protein MotA [Clostridia bacterium]
MSKWDILTPVGIVLGLTLVFVAISLGSSVGLFFSVSSLLITVGGSFSALLVNYQWKQIVGVFKTLKKVLSTEPLDREEIITVFTDLARKARREGLLGLEDDIERLDDRFFQKGLRLMIDALDPEQINEILQADMEATAFRHKIGQGVFKTWGTLAPAFGMIGTLIGLIQMLSKLDDPSALGPSMALALITTFYGALMANLVFIPVAGKLELLSDQEILTKKMMMDGITAIQTGMNPRILEEKLRSYMDPEINSRAEEGLENDVAI